MIKTILILVACFVPFSCFAGVCFPIEYAQVKDMTKAQMEVRYCRYTTFADEFREAADKAYKEYENDMAKHDRDGSGESMLTKFLWQQYDKNEKNWNVCSDESTKVTSALLSNFKVVSITLDCAAKGK